MRHTGALRELWARESFFRSIRRFEKRNHHSQFGLRAQRISGGCRKNAGQWFRV